MPNNEHLLKQTQQQKIMKKYEVVQKLWGFYGSGLGGTPIGVNIANSWKN